MTDNQSNYEELEGLSEEEKQAVLTILDEYAHEGSSETLEKIKLFDYKEIPVDIETFLTDDRYLGKAWKDSEGKSKLYPFWLEKLKLLFPDNLTTSVNNYIESGARGLGKSEVAVGACCAYLMYRVMCLKNPLEFFNLKPTEKVCFAFMNITKTLAEEIAVDKFQKTIQLSPWFMSKGTMTQRNGVPYWEPPEPIAVIIGSQSSHVLGQPIYFAFFDEISFIRNQDIDKQKEKAIDMIDTAIGGMKTRFIKNGKNPTLLVLASSKRSEKSFLEEHMKKKLASEKENVLIVDEPVWKVKPKGTYNEKTFRVALGNKYLQSQIIPDADDGEVWEDRGFKIINVPIDFKPQFVDDMDRSLCDFAGISSSEISKYISGVAVHEIITDQRQNPFTRDILEIGNGPDDTQQYYDSFDLSRIPEELKYRPLFIHLDMSVSGDMTGIAGVWIKGKKPSIDELSQANDLYYSLAFSVSIKAPKGRQVSFEKNRNFIYWLKEQGFAIKGITSDTFQSYDTGQALRAKGYPYDVLSVDRVDTDHICKPYQYFKSTIYEKRLELYKSKTLIDEIVDLERNINTGKVDHPSGGCFTGETKVRLVDGRSLSFLELIDEFNSGKINYVYSFNKEKKCIEPKKILKAWLTKKNQPLVKITLDNDESVECTLNHKFMLRDGTYIEAKDLIPGDSLMPLYTRISDKGLEGYRLYYEPITDDWHYEHRKFASDVLDEKYLVHHKNYNKLDNSPSNLIWMSKAEHIRVHSNSGTGAYSDEANNKRKNSLKEFYVNNKDNYKQRAVKISKKLKDNYANEHDGKYSEDILLEHIDEIEKTFNVTYSELSINEKNSLGVKLSRIKNPEIITKVAEINSKHHKEGMFKNAEDALKEHNDYSKMLKKLYPEIDKEKFKELFGFDYDSIDNRHKAPWNVRYRIKLHSILNHKVKSIEFIDKTADVYDIEVEDNHNFALDCGVFVHNSKDVCDAVCGAIYNASKHAEEFAFEYGETLDALVNANQDNPNTQKQIIVDFEEELKRSFDSFSSDYRTDTNKKDSDYFQDFGMGKATSAFNPTYLSNGIII